jgi:hypothetical protein
MKNNNLHNIKDSGFKTPDHYFECLEDSILNEVQLSENIEVPDHYFDGLEDIILSKAKLSEKVNTTGFKTPEDYFNTIEDAIINKVEIKQNQKIIPLFNKKTFLYISSIAAVILLFFSLPIFSNEKNTEALSISDIDTELIDKYVLDETQATDLAILFTETELDETSFINYNLSDDALDTYLEDLDENELILQ